jgi:hypothetical protein
MNHKQLWIEYKNLGPEAVPEKLADRIELLATLNFNAYREMAGGMTYDNKPIPEWINLSDSVRSFWMNGAWAVYNAMILGLGA